MKKAVFILMILLTFAISIANPIQGKVSSKLEIFSWWTAPGEIDGLTLLFENFQQQNKSIEVVNAAIKGGAGLKAKTTLKTRMLQGNPPDSFQTHGGAELIQTWVKTGYLIPLTKLWKKENWFKVYHQELINLITYQDEVYSVPLNIHRANLLWYNVPLFRELGITPPKSIQEFLQIAPEIKKRGYVPLAISSKNKWPVAHLFEIILLDVGGAAFYQALVEGTIPWTDERVITSLRYLKKIMVYTNLNHASLSWDEACQLLLTNKAAMTIMGSWAQGFFTAKGKKAGIDFNAIPAFTTSDYFLLVTDTFSLPREAPNLDKAIQWLRMIGQKEVQIKASNKMGSIPARLDIKPKELNSINQEQLLDFYNTHKLPSIVHGIALVDTFASLMIDELASFIYKPDPYKTTQELEKQAQLLGIRLREK